MRVIRAGDLTLEPQTAAHAEEMFAVLGDPAIYEYENEPPESLEWLRGRFTRLESRRSPDGSEQWLNWVVRAPASGPIGFVQATVRADGSAAIAYVMSSAHWGRGLATRAVGAMIAELAGHYGVTRFSALAKRRNRRSLRLLERLGFAQAPSDPHAASGIEADEVLMLRQD